MIGQLTETPENSDTSLLLHLDELPELVEKTAKFSGRCEVVRQLEERFDALLFDRRRYRLQLTPAGELLVSEAARLMQDPQLAITLMFRPLALATYSALSAAPNKSSGRTWESALLAHTPTLTVTIPCGLSL